MSFLNDICIYREQMTYNRALEKFSISWTGGESSWRRTRRGIQGFQHFTVSSKMMCREKAEQECEEPLSPATVIHSFVQQGLPTCLWQAVHCFRDESRDSIINNKWYFCLCGVLSNDNGGKLTRNWNSIC